MGKEIMDCEICGTTYILNDNINFIKKVWKDTWEDMIYIPNCKCEEKEVEKRLIASQEQERKNNRQKVIDKYKSLSDGDNNLSQANLDDIDGEGMRKFIKRYVEKVSVEANIGLLLYGLVGCGKSYIASAITNHLRKEGKLTVLYISAKRFIDGCKGWQDGTDINIKEAVRKVDVLVLDDLGSGKKSEWSTSQIFDILDSRNNDNKATIITSNYMWVTNGDDEYLKLDGYGRVKDRIRSLCHPIRVKGESKRKPKVF